MKQRAFQDNYSELIEYNKAVRTVAMIALIAGLVLVTAAFLFGKLSVVYIMLTFVVLDIILLIMIRKGYGREAGYVLMLFIPMMITYLVLNGTGLNDPGILGYSATVISASLLFGRRSIIAFSAINFIQVLGVYLMENYGDRIGWMRQTASPSNFFDFVTVEVLLLVSSGIFWVIIGRITRQADRLEELVHLRTSQLEKNNEELQRTQKHLIQKERMASLGGLVAGLAHEVNTPLGICVTASTYMEEITEKMQAAVSRSECSLNEISDYFENASVSSKLIYSSLKRAQKLITSFKQLSVDQSAETEREIGFPGYIQDIAAGLSRDLKRRKVTVSIECPEPIQVVSFPGHFYQIYTNLIINSLIHGFDGRDSGEIRITIARSGDDVQMVYSDNGVGVPPQHIGRIFEPFYSTRLGDGGSGLGLSVIYNIIIQIFGGSIEGISEPGGGLVLRMVFPGLANNEGQYTTAG